MIKNLREMSVYDINPVIYEKVYEWLSLVRTLALLFI